MKRNCFYSDFNIEVDSCPKCEGVWLDPGELNFLREQNEGRGDRKKIIDNFSEQVKESKGSARVQAVIDLLFK
jgi:Zn-finger nucleic acid-binding protein